MPPASRCPACPWSSPGHNEHVAWGFTALYGDVQDLYIEKLDGKGNYQASDTTWKPLAIDHEIIHVRGGKDVAIDVQSTDHGPLLTPLLHARLAPHRAEMDALRHVAELHSALRDEYGIELGGVLYRAERMVLANAERRLLRRPGPHRLSRRGPHSAAARGPCRRTHCQRANRTSGRATSPSTPCPTPFDPPSGFLATANSRVTTEKSPIPLTLEWVDPYRAERIYKLLQGRDQLTPKDMLAVQTDIYSEMDQELAHRFAYAIDHCRRRRPPAQGRRPDAQLGWPAHHRLCSPPRLSPRPAQPSCR